MSNNKNMAGVSLGLGIACLAIGLYGMFGRGESFLDNIAVITIGLVLFGQAYLLRKG